MGWNLEELRNLCIAKHLPDSTVYQDTLQWKLERVELYGRLARTLWDDLFSQDEVEINEVRKMRSEYQAHIESAAQALHSMADILAQIVNQAILAGALSEDDVSLDAVLKQMTRAGIADNVRKTIQTLKDSDEFKYINAFVNTIKHRKLLDTTYLAEYGIDRRNDDDFVFESFVYRGDNFPEVWAKDIVGNYKPNIIDMINTVGGEVNTYLR